MIGPIIDDYEIDTTRVFITGLSSGGAMATVMLATYPELFAGGAIIAGRPYRSAATLFQAVLTMKGFGGPKDQRLGALVRSASAFTGRWPTVSIWHGGADKTVVKLNAQSILWKWQKIHKLNGPPTYTEKLDGISRQVWCNATGHLSAGTQGSVPVVSDIGPSFHQRLIKKGRQLAPSLPPAQACERAQTAN